MKKSLIGIVSSVTGFSLTKRTKHDNLTVLFYKDALLHGHHGAILANSVLHRFESTLVRFVFPGLTEAPEMTPELMEHIWNRAAAAGFEALSLKAYGTKISARTSPTPAGAVSTLRREAEDAKAGQKRDIPVASLPSSLSRDRTARDAGNTFDQMQNKAHGESLLRMQAQGEAQA